MMYSSRHLQQVSIALLCLWVTLMLQAMNELFQESYQYQHPNQRYYSSAYEEFMHKHHHPTGHVIRIQNTKKQYHQREDPDPAMHPTLRHHHHGKTNHSMSLSSSANGTMPMTRGFGKKHHHHHHPKRLHFGNATKLKEAVALAEQKTLLPGPIIVVGFPKAGTSSIFAFFRNQQRRMKCQHWYCCQPQKSAQSGGPALMADCMLDNLIRNRSIFRHCGHFDVYAEINGPRPVVRAQTGPNEFQPAVLLDDGSLDFESAEPNKRNRIFFPQYFNLLDIHEAYPNATFILNTRDFDSWIHSVQNWFGDNLDWQFINEFYRRGQLDRLPDDRNNQTQKAELMRIIYDKHHDQIRRFVQDYPSHILVEVPILHPNASQILADAFGLDASKWAKVNAKKAQSRIMLFPGVQRTIRYFENLIPDYDEEPFQYLSMVVVLTFVGTYTALEGIRLFYQRCYRRRRGVPLGSFFRRRNG